MAKLVERLLASTALWVRIQASKKYKTGDISKGMANAKKYLTFGVSSPRLQHSGFVYRIKSIVARPITLWCSAVCDETTMAVSDLLGICVVSDK